MPAAKKKCICQLCTCGRHMCPHRKKEQLVLGTEQKSAKSLSQEDKRKHRKQWEVPNDKQDISLRKDQLNTTFVLSESTSLATALTVDDKGNSKSSGLRNESKNWSAKQITKTLPIRRPDNLKSEGTADFTTTHQHDFHEKISESHATSSVEESSATVQAESWNKRQIPRTQKIKKADTLTLSGPLNLETTHQSEYNESILKDKTTLGESNLHQTYQRPRTSLKLSGEFQSDSSYQQAFTLKRAEDGVKVQKGVSKGHLKPEGEMTFDTTSLDYNAVSTHVSRASEMGDGAVVLKPKRSRPQSEIKISSDPISDETTLVSDFKRWNVEKPTRHKPADTLQIGSTEETDSVSTRRNGDSSSRTDASKIQTSMSDHANWKVTRPVVQKPQNNLKPEGDFHFDTTHDVDYNSRRDMGKKSSVLEPLTERTETESIAPDEHFTREIAATESIVDNTRHVAEIGYSGKHKDSISVAEGAVKHEVQANTSAAEGAVQPAVDANISVSEGLTKQEVISDTSNRIEQQVYEDNEVISQSEDQGHYVSWDEIRPKPIRPHSNLRQEGGMEFSTTNRSEFISRSTERVKGIRPQPTTKLFDGDFDATTMNQVMFSSNQGEKVSPIRPVSNLHVEKGGFIDETTSSREFQPWKVERPSPIVPRSNLAQEGTMDFTTTNHTEFEEKRPEKVYPIRPTTTNKISGDLELITTNRVMHSEFPLERVQKIVPQSNLRMSSGVFDSETTNQSQFQEWEIDRPKPIRPVPNLTQEGSMDFTTMNQMQFEEKPIEKVSQIRPHTSSKITGDFDGVTTNQIMFPAQPSQRPNMIKPKGNLEVEKGKFATDTTNHTEFQQWQQSKPDLVTPRNNLHQEGSRDFTTTNQVQYGAKLIDRVSEIRPKTNTKTIGEFDGTTTNQVMYQDSPREKLQAIRPQNNIQLEKGDFNTETTNNKEYQQWEYSKPSLIKPHSSIRQEGNMDFTTTNDREFMGKTAEKVSPIKPSAMTKIEGKFESTTTNQAMFKNNTVERVVKGKRPTTNLHVEKGKIENQTTASREFQQWEINRPEQIKPTGNLIQEGEMDFTTSNQTDYAGKQATKVEAIRPHASSPTSGEFDGTTTNQVMFQGRTMEKVHDIRPKNNLRVDSGQFNEETTTSKEYGYKKGIKLEAIKPKSSLTQEGQFDFKTSNQMQFEEKQINKVTQIRPKTLTKGSDEKFDSITTNQAMFQTPVMDTVHEIRPSDNLHVEVGKFQNQTTSSDEYQHWKIQKPTAFQLASSLKQEGNMQFETTNNAEFKERSFDRVQQIRPKTTNKITEGEFESTTTNQAMFQQHSNLERVKPIRHENNLQVESGKFDKETTNSRDFKQWVKMENKDSLNKRHSQAAGVRTQIEKSVSQKDTEIQKTKVETQQSQYEPWKLNEESAATQAQSQKLVNDHIDISNTGSKTVSQNQQVNIDKSVSVGLISATSDQQLDQSLIKDKVQTQTSHRTIGVNDKRQQRAENISTMTSDYAGKQTTKVRSIIPSGNISSEGEMSFSTTSKADYVRQTGSRYKQETNQQVNINKSGKMVLTSTSADQLDRSSNKNDVQIQSPRRTLDSIERKQHKAENISTMTSDYAGKQASSKARAIIPSGNISSEGEMSFSTTSKSDYVRQTGSRKQLDANYSKSSEKRGRTQSNIASQDYDLKTLQTSETQVKGDSKVFNETTQFTSSGAKMSTMNLSPQTVISRTIRHSKPDDNLKIEPVPFDGVSTTKTEYRRVEGRRSSSKKPSESLKQEGNMEFNTTSNDYSLTEAYNAGREATKAKSKKDQRGSLGQSGAMDFHTTSNSSYTGNVGSKSKNLRPRSSIKLGADETSYESMSSTRSNPETSTREYQNITSTSRASYVGHTPTRTRAYRPTTSQKVGEGSFEGQTTSRASFVAQDRAEKSRAIKPANHNILNTDNGFTGGTTYRNSFESTKGHHCPVLDLQAGRSSFTMSEEKNGHIFYAQEVQG